MAFAEGLGESGNVSGCSLSALGGGRERCICLEQCFPGLVSHEKPRGSFLKAQYPDRTQLKRMLSVQPRHRGSLKFPREARVQTRLRPTDLGWVCYNPHSDSLRPEPGSGFCL